MILSLCKSCTPIRRTDLIVTLNSAASTEYSTLINIVTSDTNAQPNSNHSHSTSPPAPLQYYFDFFVETAFNVTQPGGQQWRYTASAHCCNVNNSSTPLITNRWWHRGVKGPRHLRSNSPRQLLVPNKWLANYESQPVRPALDWPDTVVKTSPTHCVTGNLKLLTCNKG
jgi:hypothetical protein